MKFIGIFLQASKKLRENFLTSVKLNTDYSATGSQPATIPYKYITHVYSSTKAYQNILHSDLY